MRIVGGKHRGRLIKPVRNIKARPTTDYAKESLFNILNNQIDFEDVDVLDLFSGTGAISYEFASRGAKSVTSVELSTINQQFIKETAKKFGFENFKAVKSNAFHYVKRADRSFDVIFADPPYDLEKSETIVDLILKSDILADDGILIFEHGKNINLSSHPSLTDSRVYGNVSFSFFRK